MCGCKFQNQVTIAALLSMGMAVAGPAQNYRARLLVPRDTYEVLGGWCLAYANIALVYNAPPPHHVAKQLPNISTSNKQVPNSFIFAQSQAKPPHMLSTCALLEPRAPHRALFWLPVGSLWLPLAPLWLFIYIYIYLCFLLSVGSLWFPLATFWLPVCFLWLFLVPFWLPII